MDGKTKGLSSWQLTMMALGTVIGGSFFLGSSVAISAAGPAVLFSFILGGILVFFILFALSEMTVANPDSGSFRTFAANAFGSGTGFVVGWVYWTGMVLAMSSEATAASILIQEWVPNASIPLLGSVIILSVTLLNLLGADKLSKLESGLAAVKLLAIASFIILGILLIVGWIPGISSIGSGELAGENVFSNGIKGIAGSMLIVIFSYAGFEVIGLAASEASDPDKTVPRAIRNTVICLISFYIIAIAVMLPLIPTASLKEDISPMVAALLRWGMGWAGTAINFVLITAILSTMLAAMFGLGRMIRSLADEKMAPNWLIDKKDVPYRGILFSGLSMLLGLGLGLLVPRVYLFLISSGGFALLFTYAVIMATHIRFRKTNGCPPKGRCQMPGYPYASWIVLICLIAAIFSMPLIEGQGAGLAAGIIFVTAYLLIYQVLKYMVRLKNPSAVHRFGNTPLKAGSVKPGFSTEYSEELTNRNDNACNSNQELPGNEKNNNEGID